MCIHYKLIKLNFVVCSVLLLSSWWQQPLEKTYNLWCQNGVMVIDSFTNQENQELQTTCFVNAETDVGDLSAFVTE